MYKSIEHLQKRSYSLTTNGCDISAETLSEILSLLDQSHPQPETNSEKQTPYQLLIRTILLTQTTELVASKVARDLFAQFPTPEKMVAVGRRELELLIQPSGFYRQKAKYIQETSRILLERHNGAPPQTLIALTQLPGIARKTANQFLAEAYQTAEGIIVNTHVHRVANRVGISHGKSAAKVEHDLVKLTDPKDRIRLSELFMAHGQKVCYIHEPACGRCVLREMCSFSQKSAESL